jgi:hypothetical protein
VVQLEGTLSEPEEYQARPRICDLGLLRTTYKKKDGLVGYRCAGEPPDIYLRKSGKEEETPGRKCICNGLTAAVGLGQEHPRGYAEKPLITSGDDILRVALFLKGNKLSYSAADVIQFLLGNLSPAQA